MTATIIQGDCLEQMEFFDDNYFDSIVTDPPYGLSFMGKDWDRGVPGTHFWKEFLRVAKPGAHLLAFGGTRTHHRLMVAVEDAGWEIRDCLMWVYGSGFPKSLDVSKAIDKAAGKETVVGSIPDRWTGKGNSLNFSTDRAQETCKITEPCTDAAKQWNGWGTALKPAYEIIILAQKPYPMEQYINIASLYIIEAKLWSLLPANVAEKNFGLNPAEFKEALDSVQWNVEEKSNIQEDLFDQMDISQFVSVMTSCLNTVILWRNTLGEFSNGVKTSTTSMEIDPTIDLKTLNSCLSVLTPHIIIRDAIRTHGQWQHASPAVKYLNAVSQRLNATHILSAPEIATLQEHIKHPEGTVVSKYPAWEPIILARKPLEGTVANNVQKWGCGGINVDGCGVPTDPSVDDPRLGGNGTWSSDKMAKNVYEGGYAGERVGSSVLGRFPANLIHDGSDEVLTCFPHSTSGAMKKSYVYTNNGYSLGKPSGSTKTICEASEGSAARFFYCAKASKSERGEGNNHPTVKPQALLRYLCRLITPPSGTILDPFAGSGSTGIAATAEGFTSVLIEIDKGNIEIARKRNMVVE